MTRQARVDQDTTRERLELAGLTHAAERLDELLESSNKTKDAPHRFLDRLLDAELSQRE